MGNLEPLGRWLVVAGLAIVVIGAIVWLISRIPGIKDIPGTLQINLGSSLTCIVPILASIVLSILLTIILNVIMRIGKH
jgi:hypothetical protein